MGVCEVPQERVHERVVEEDSGFPCSSSEGEKRQSRW